MAHGPLVPSIWLDDRAEEAARFYVDTFGGRVVATTHYPASTDNPSKRPRGSVLTVDVDVRDLRFTLLNGGTMFRPNPSVSFFVRVETPAEVDRLYAALVAGGSALMEVGAYPWSERYAWVSDRFGVSFQLITGAKSASDATIVPCLMFANAQHGRAEEAMKAYTSIFPNSRIASVERYAAGEGPEGTVKHGRFVVAGQELVAMDSHVKHAFGFDEGISLQMMCRDQAEVDRTWEALAADGGKHVQCGWVTDRFGLSWQVVPERMSAWMTSGDVAARDRAFDAIMHMRRLDIEAIERAFRGGGDLPTAAAPR